jgi:hypothetical protein
VTVTLNEAALEALLDSPTGPVGLLIDRKAAEVATIARENASGPIIGIRSGDLIGGLHSTGVQRGLGGLFATVSTQARHRGFAYPTFHDETGRPWLTGALALVFSRARVGVGI